MEWECWKFRRKPGKTNQKRKTKKKKKKEKRKKRAREISNWELFSSGETLDSRDLFWQDRNQKKKYNLSIVNCQMSDVSCQLQQLMRIALHCDRKSKTKTKNKV